MNITNSRLIRTALLLSLLFPLLTAPLAAQWATAPRLASQTTASLDPQIERGAPTIKGQLFAGFAGLVVGTALGVTTGLMLGMGADDSDGFETVAVTATLAGVLGGTTYGVYKFSQAKGGQGKALSTFGGATLGLLGGPLLWVTVPLGARWGYNKSRTDGAAPLTRQPSSSRM